MKKLMLVLAISGLAFAGNAQNDKKETKKETAKTEKSAKPEMKMKEHVCTDACKDGKHMYAHGEKGHVCTDACKKKM